MMLSCLLPVFRGIIHKIIDGSHGSICGARFLHFRTHARNRMQCHLAWRHWGMAAIMARSFEASDESPLPPGAPPPP